MARFVLVHGAWSSGVVWERVTPVLEAEGHAVDAVDLPGRGSSPAAPAEMTLDAYVRHVAGRVDAAGGPVVLVGHSMGGMSITGAAELVPERIARLVYVTAFLPNDGQSLPDLAAGNPDDLVRPNLVVDQATGLCRVREEVQRGIFFGRCSEADAALALSRRVPESLAAIQGRLRLTDERAGSVPRAYVECTLDRGITIQMQRRMQAARPCDPVLELAADHAPFYSAPGELAERLLVLAA